MAKDPAVLFYTSDFLIGCSYLTFEERGQYITLLCLQHQLGRIPENHMISICKSKESPVIKKFVQENGHYYNIRMAEEIEKRINYCNSRSNNKSGRPKKKIIRKSYDYHMENENENENKDNKYNVGKKKRHLEFVFLTDEEYKKLVNKFGQREADEKIESLNNYIGSKGKKYKSHYHTIMTWSRNDKSNSPSLKEMGF